MISYAAAKVDNNDYFRAGCRFLLTATIAPWNNSDMENNKAVRKYAVISNHGYTGNESRVWSAHSTASAVLRAARKPCYLAISSEGGFERGQTVYMDMIGSVYHVVPAAR
jgi:hypothetical protein